MGNRSRVLSGLQPTLAISDTGISLAGCRVLIGHPDPQRAVAGAEMFGGQLGNAIRRAKCFNMSDFYSAYIDINNKIVSGESLN